MLSKLQKFCTAAQGLIRFEDEPELPQQFVGRSNHPVAFQTRTEFQKWLTLTYVDFAEVFRGYGEATIRVREAGCTASEGFDKCAITYERAWHLDEPTDQRLCAWLLVYMFKPKAIHLGTPCTKLTILSHSYKERVEKDPQTLAQIRMHRDQVYNNIMIHIIMKYNRIHVE